MSDAITVRRASKSDVPAIIRFIREQWNPNHIFVIEPGFFEYMLCDGNDVNVIIAADSSGKIYGMEGVTFYNSSDRPDSGILQKSEISFRGRVKPGDNAEDYQKVL